MKSGKFMCNFIIRNNGELIAWKQKRFVLRNVALAWGNNVQDI